MLAYRAGGFNLAREQLRRNKRRREAALDSAKQDRLAHPTQEQSRFEARQSRVFWALGRFGAAAISLHLACGCVTTI